MTQVLKEYFEKFGEYPYLLMTQTYNDDGYMILMLKAIDRGTPLSKDEIANFFENQYDIVVDKPNYNGPRKSIDALFEN